MYHMYHSHANLRRHPAFTTFTYTGALIVFGGGDARLRAGPIEYAPMRVVNGTYDFAATVESATIGDSPLPLDPRAPATASIDTVVEPLLMPRGFFEALATVL